ncbi:hypothetical protein ACP70R_038297 [Stipagrostis hirtigluma subsp. patula]
MLVPFSLARNPSLLLLLLPPAATRVAGFAMSTSTAAAAVSVEYAKSGRSSCKGCSGGIASGALRLGASARDPRGFESTKWYHVSCFPAASNPLGPVERIKGFDSIKDEDREELRELEKMPSLIVRATHSQNHKTDQTAVGSVEEPSPKRVKTQMSSSAEGVSDKASVSVEYAKSGRSTCKGCNENIAKAALRLGASSRDPRGFDSTKWYHVACFPVSAYQVFPVENLKGFDSIENHDREMLQGLEDHKRDGNVAGESNEQSLEKKTDHSIGDSKQDAELEDTKLSAANKRTGPLISFSASDIKKTYKDATLPAHWKVFDTVIFREQEDGLHASAKVAAFDFDGCLAKTSVKRIGADKWSLQHKSIPEKLQRLYNDGYKLVIFTNESNIERWKNKRQEAVDSKVGRLDNFIECVKVPIQVFIACGLGKGKGTPDDLYRKPNPGMWWLMAQHFNSGIEIDMDQSFYVGDAAGRENDHSNADKEFAKAIGLKFYVPEEYFSP